MEICRENECAMGPGAWASAVSSVVWLLLAIEMKINSPLCTPVVKPGPGVVVIEMKSPGYISGLKRNWRKLVGQNSREWENVPSLSRVAMKKQKERIDVGRIGIEEMDTGRRVSSYRPPMEILDLHQGYLITSLM